MKFWLATLILTSGTFFGCDPHNKKKCEWYLMPEPSLIGKSSPGFIPVCARNLTINKEYCRLEASMDLAKSVYGKKFRFDDMEIDKAGRFPKKVVKIDFSACQ
jgi:hypothetical protein